MINAQEIDYEQLLKDIQELFKIKKNRQAPALIYIALTKDNNVDNFPGPLTYQTYAQILETIKALNLEIYHRLEKEDLDYILFE